MSDSEAWVDQECPTPIHWPQMREYILRRTKAQDAEIEKLKAELARLDCGSCMNTGRIDSDGFCGNCELGRLKSELEAVTKERDEARQIIAQHELCHFAKGCESEQRRIYGCAPHADALDSANADADLLGREVSKLEGIFGKDWRSPELNARPTAAARVKGDA